MELRDELTSALERLLATGRVKVQENGAWLASLEYFRYELREKGHAVVLHLWTDESTLVRRVVQIETDEPGKLKLQVRRFGRERPDTLEFSFWEHEPDLAQLRREQFRSRFGEMLSRYFPDESVSSLITAPDLEHSLSGNYVRGITSARRNRIAVMAAAPGESAATYDALLTFGLLWLDHLRLRKSSALARSLRLFLPEGTAGVVSYRSKALCNSASVELYDYDPSTWSVRRRDPRDAGNLETWLVPRREIESAMAQAQIATNRIIGLNPSAISVEPIAGTSDIALRFRGLLFARWSQGTIFFGVGAQRPLTSSNKLEFDRLVGELERYRAPVSPGPHHPLYRAQAERWLEWLVMTQPTSIDPRMDRRFVYSQVPANSVGDRGIMDLLAITRGGRLAVIELKVSEDVQLVMQAVDYWLRVRHHQEQQDFPRYGYFSGVNITSEPPLLFLVAPSLQFHPAAEVLARYFSPGIEIYRVGVNQNWRHGLRIVSRQPLLTGPKKWKQPWLAP
jgi:hypothetical protein